MHTSKTLKVGAAAAALAVIGTGAMAAGSDTGVEAGFYAAGQDLQTIVEGAGGYLIMIVSIIIGGITLAVTGRWNQVAIAVGVALFLGYGLQTVTSLGGVTADTGMLELSAVEIPAAASTIQ
ncbi:MAG: hypothetical protein AB3N24_19345 [Leisingera sp.]